MAATVSRSSSKRGTGKSAGRAGGGPRQRVRNEASAGGNAPRRTDGDVATTLAELLALGRDGWVVSCYQKLEPGDRAGEKYRIKLKNRLRRAQERLEVLGFENGDRKAITEVLARVEEFFGHSQNLDGARGLAVFAGPGWLKAVRLPHVLKSRVLVDRTPVVGELVALTEAGTRVLVAVADRTAARIFEVDLDGVQEIEGVVAQGVTPSTRYHEDDGAPGMGEYKFHTRIREEKHRHFHNVAEEIKRALRRKAYDGVIVGGIGVDADAILPHLPTEARDKVIGVLRLAPKHVTPAEIRVRAMELWGDAGEAASADAVGELEGLKASNWAVDGVEESLKALFQGQVRTLIVDHDAEQSGYRMSKSGRLTTSPSALKSEGEAIPIPDVIDDAIEDALRQRSRVAVVRGDQAAGINHMAAVLRFRITGK